MVKSSGFESRYSSMAAATSCASVGIMGMAQLGTQCEDNIDLTGWHMILNHYGPTIDAALIRKHLMPLVSRSPHVAIHTINSFGLTFDEFRDYVTTRLASNEPFEPTVTAWLGFSEEE
ncbi:hypothetical protein Pelo_9012 [Pelomyxa schiedti]|nr:hypothetical protein Pelo_9012 [Pelomyxa schiedti]